MFFYMNWNCMDNMGKYIYNYMYENDDEYYRRFSISTYFAIYVLNIDEYRGSMPFTCNTEHI